MLPGFAIGDRILSPSGDTHPLWSMAFAEAGAYRIVGASAVGQLHIKHGRPRDDAFVIRSAGPWLAVGVCDGVGSRPLSRYGASFVSESLAALLLRPLLPKLSLENEVGDAASDEELQRRKRAWQEALAASGAPPVWSPDDELVGSTAPADVGWPIAVGSLAWTPRELSATAQVSPSTQSATPIPDGDRVGAPRPAIPAPDPAPLMPPALSRYRLTKPDGFREMLEDLLDGRLDMAEVLPPELDKLLDEGRQQFGRDPRFRQLWRDIEKAWQYVHQPATIGVVGAQSALGSESAPATPDMASDPPPQSDSPAAGGDTRPTKSFNGGSRTDRINLRSVVEEAFRQTQKLVALRARDLGIDPPRELGCTALGLLFNVETGALALGQVGDGAILVLGADGSHSEPLREQLSENDSQTEPNATYTLATADLDRHLAVIVNEMSGKYDAFYVMTDGISSDILYSKQDWKSWAVDVRRNVLRSSDPSRAAAGMLNWLATFKVQGSWDDRTLVVIARQDQSGDTSGKGNASPG